MHYHHTEIALHYHLTLIDLPSASQTEDVYSWVVNGVDCRGFSSAKTWEALQPRESKKDWADLIWFQGCIQKHAFHMWTAQLERLPTRTRTASWGLSVSLSCPVCLVGLRQETIYCSIAVLLQRYGQLFSIRWTVIKHLSPHGLSFYLGLEVTQLQRPLSCGS